MASDARRGVDWTDEQLHPTDTSDPRVTPRFVRWVDATDDVCLVGVVHGHPASVHRVRTVVEAVDPTVLALEVPPLATSLFEQYATDEHVPPRFGGEYSAAIQATDARVVGIDGPNRRFVTTLLRRCVDERVSLDAARRLASGLANASREALTHRLLATIAAATPITAAVDRSFDHGCSTRDDPETQAATEHATVDRVEGVLDALGRPTAVRVRDETREACMVDRLAELGADGPVVAIVGVGHLDAIEDGLQSMQ